MGSLRAAKFLTRMLSLIFRTNFFSLAIFWVAVETMCYCQKRFFKFAFFSSFDFYIFQLLLKLFPLSTG
jgi:hypothetical protein